MVPEAGDTVSHWPPEVVDAEAPKFDDLVPLFRMVSVCPAGLPPPASVWKRNPVCESCNCAGPLLTVRVTAMLNGGFSGTAMDTVPKYVPASKPLGFTLTVTELMDTGATAPAAGDTDSQLLPEFTVALAVKLVAELPLFEITMD